MVNCLLSFGTFRYHKSIIRNGKEITHNFNKNMHPLPDKITFKWEEGVGKDKKKYLVSPNIKLVLKQKTISSSDLAGIFLIINEKRKVIVKIKDLCHR